MTWNDILQRADLPAPSPSPDQARNGSLHMRDCPFCLSNNQLDGGVLAQDRLCYMTQTGDPVLQSSVLIIPFRHVATPFELTVDEWMSTHRLLMEAKQLLDMEGPDGYSIGWNVHPVGGQSIPHAHLHVIGRFADEPLAGQGIRHALKQEQNRRPSRPFDDLETCL